MKVFRKLLRLGQDIGNPFPYEHEWLYNLINSYDDIDKNEVYSLFGNNTDYISIRQDFMITILTETHQYYDIVAHKDAYDAVNNIIELWKKDPTGQNKQEWSSALSEANAVSNAAESTLYSTAWGAANAARAASIAWSAPWTTARCVARGAGIHAAENAVESEEDSAASVALIAAEIRQIQLLNELIKKYNRE